MGWFGGLITRKSQERTKQVNDYRAHLEDLSVRSMKLPLDAYSTETSAAMGAWVLLECNDKERTGSTAEGGGQNSQLESPEAGGERPAVSSRGEALTPNVRNVDHVDGVDVLATVRVLQCYSRVVEGGQDEL